MLVAMSAGMVAGVCSQLLWPALPLIAVLGVCAVLSLGLLSRSRGMWREIAALVAGLAIGMGLATLQGQRVLDARLPASYEGVDFLVEGRILAVQQMGDGGQSLRLAFDVLPWRRHVYGFPGWQLRLSTRDALPALPGERWRMVARLKRPRAFANPGVADFERYLFGERVVATGYVRANEPPRRVAPATGWAALRLLLLEHALPLLGDGPGDIADNEAERFARAVLPALILDERSLLSSSQWRVLADTGTAHLVAISGLHVALLWGALVWLVGLLRRRRPDALRYRACTVVPALAVAVGYAALAGMPLPALRASVMLAVASIFLLVAGTVPAWRVLLASASVVLMLDPLAVHASGFWLSFGAVAVLLLLNDLRRRDRGVWIWPAPAQAALIGLRMQALLSLLLAPFLVVLFGAASISSVVANVPAIPLVNLLALPPGMLGFSLAPLMPSLANPLLDTAVAGLSWLWSLLELINDIAWMAPLQAHAAGSLHAGLFLLLLTLLLFAGSTALRGAILLSGCLAWPVVAPPAQGTARVCVLEVGQGLAVLVRGAAHALLYDAGPAWGERDAGASIVVPAARALGVSRLDWLLLSHDDGDHAGGADSVRQALRPADIILGDTRSRDRLGGTGRPCLMDEQWQRDGVHYRLFPGTDDGSDNDRSCILHVSAGDRGLLLPGDMTRRRELALLEAHGDVLASAVLVAGHHGSRTSSSATFLHRVRPDAVIFSMAHGNRFGHPHPEVEARARRQGALTFRTAQSGALCLLLSSDSAPIPRAWRSRERRFWRE